MPANNTGNDHRVGYLAGGALIGIIIAALVWSYGGSRVQALGVGLLCVGLSLWIGSMTAGGATQTRVDERTRRQRYRSRAIGLGLGALVVMFYVATLVRLGPNALKRDGFADVQTQKKNVIIEDNSACKRAGTC